MNSFIYLVFFAQLGLLTNAFPAAEHEGGSSSTPVVEFSPFLGIAGITSSIADNLRNAAKTTKTISNVVINGDTLRIRGFWSWLSGMFGGSKKNSRVSSFGPAHSGQVHRDDIILTITNTNDFNTKVVNSKTPILVMYTFTGSVAHSIIGPTIKNYILSLNGKMLFAEINVNNIDVPNKASIVNFPTIQVYHNGQASVRYGPMDTQNNYQTLMQPYIRY